MKMNRRYPLVRLPESVDLTLFLIREELKSTRFFSSLHRLGLSDCPFQTHLGSAIVAQIGFSGFPDDLFEFYHALFDQHSAMLDENLSTLTSQALEIYQSLAQEKRRREVQSAECHAAKFSPGPP